MNLGSLIRLISVVYKSRSIEIILHDPLWS
jgi:hypothetical protein